MTQINSKKLHKNTKKFQNNSGQVTKNLVIPAIIIVLILLIASYFLVNGFGGEKTATFTIVSSNGVELSDILVPAFLTRNSDANSFSDLDISARTNEEGIVYFSGLQNGDMLRINISNSRGTYENIFTINSNLQETINLQAIGGATLSNKTLVSGLKVLTQTGVNATGANIIFSCSNSSEEPTPNSAIFSGNIIDINYSPACGKVYAKINLEGYEQAYNELSSGLSTIVINDLDVETIIAKTNLRVSILENGFPVSQRQFSVALRDSSNIIIAQASTTNSEVTLQAPAGSYTITVTDLNGEYIADSKPIRIENNSTSTGGTTGASNDIRETINVTRATKVKVIVKAIDSLTKTQIDGATIWAKKKNTTGEATEFFRGTTQTGVINSSGSVVGTGVIIALKDTGNYEFYAKKDGAINVGYVANFVTTTINSDTNPLTIEETTVTIALQKITASNAGKTKIKVTDQEGKVVVGAKVFLKLKADESLVELNNSVINYATTDINGEANVLAGSITGGVYAVAIYSTALGNSAEKEISLSGETIFDVKIDFGYTNILLNLQDEQGNLIDGEAEIINADSAQKIATVAITNGNGSYKTRAGRNLVVIFSSESYVPFTTEPKVVLPAVSNLSTSTGLVSSTSSGSTLAGSNSLSTITSTTSFGAVLQKTISDSEILLDGIYDASGRDVKLLSAGKKYSAILKLKMSENYSTVKIHFRAGIETIMENDFVEINSMDSYNATSERRGTSYDHMQGINFDSTNYTAGNSKWIEGTWTNVPKGEMNVRINFTVKETVLPEMELKFFWRAVFGSGLKKPVAQGNSNSTSPTRSTSSATVSSSSSTNEFYSNTYESDNYFEGLDAGCKSEFCFGSESLFNPETQLYERTPFSITQGLLYDYQYRIFNNSTKNYFAAGKKMLMNIEILYSGSDTFSSSDASNSGSVAQYSSAPIYFENYSISTKSGNFVGQRVSKITGIEITNFEKNTSIKSQFRLMGRANANTTIRTQLIADGNIIFEESRNINSSENNSFDLGVAPQLVARMVNTELEVSTEKDGVPIKDVQVDMFIKPRTVSSYFSQSVLSNELGRLTLNTGSQLAGTKIIIEAHKSGFASKKIELMVSNEIATVAPARLSVSLNSVTQREVTKTILVNNLVQDDIILTNLEVDAKFKGYINEEALTEYFNQAKGITIKQEESNELNILKIRLANDVTSQTLSEPKNISGKLLLTMRTKSSLMEFTTEIPLTINISSEASLSTDCLVVIPETKTKTVEQGKVIFNFTITNSCNSEGKPIALDFLRAKLSSEMVGQAELSLVSLTRNRVGMSALDSTKRTIISGVQENESFSGSLVFVAGLEDQGKTVPLDLELEAGYNGAIIRANPASIDFKANVVNLKQCIQIKSDETPVAYNKTSKITIDSSACLGSEISILLCRNDAGCSGGTTDGKISLSRRDLKLNKSKPTDTVTAYAPSLPGAYGITVWARPTGMSQYSYIGETPVFFSEPTTAQFNLNKFDLTLEGKGTQDVISIENKFLTQNIKIKANNCVWGKKEDFAWDKAIAGAMLGAGLGQLTTSWMGTLGSSVTTTTTGQVVGTKPSENKWETKTSTGDSPGRIWGKVGSAALTVTMAVVAGYLMGRAEDCDKIDSFGERIDYVTYLKGNDTINTTSATGQDNLSVKIPSDKGALEFVSPNGSVTPVWDFSNPIIGSTETEGLRFTNNDINNDKPTYGVLTVNAYRNLHGAASVNPNAPASTRDYDIVCQDSSFGDYWVGSAKDAGACSGISRQQVFQKYHLRLVTATPLEEEPYMRKATKCYANGSVGSTGLEALPKIKLNWDWANITEQTCSPKNPNYVYCDGTQFGIVLTKKLAKLDTFLKSNSGLVCPPNAMINSKRAEAAQINLEQATRTVDDGWAGLKSINVEVNKANNTAVVTIIVDNKASAGGANLGIALKGTGEPIQQSENITIGLGTTTITKTLDVPKYDGIYFISAMLNGFVGGINADRTAVNMTFENPVSTKEDCWVPRTTRPEGGVPALLYYLEYANIVGGSGTNPIGWVNGVSNISDLYNLVSFQTYLTKDSFTTDFLADFKKYYLTQFTQTSDEAERKVLNALDSGKIKFEKRFGGGTLIEEGLYDVAIYVDLNEPVAGQENGIIKTNTTQMPEIIISFALLRKPEIGSPFYRMPFDGMVGYDSGRQGYGAYYFNLKDTELVINNSGAGANSGSTVKTFVNSNSNGLIRTNVSTGAGFVQANSILESRGRLASIFSDATNASISFTPLIATPVIAKIVNEGTQSKMFYTARRNENPITSGGNLNYWTGASRSRNFYGSAAVEEFSLSPDLLIDEKKGVDSGITYGFDFAEATRVGKMYLKTVFFSPTDGALYRITSANPELSFWTPNEEFSSSVSLTGLDGMLYNSTQSNYQIRNLDELFNLVSQEKVCLTNDGASTNFWWNPYELENTAGASNSLAQKEISCVGEKC